MEEVTNDFFTSSTEEQQKDFEDCIELLKGKNLLVCDIFEDVKNYLDGVHYISEKAIKQIDDKIKNLNNLFSFRNMEVEYKLIKEEVREISGTYIKDGVANFLYFLNIKTINGDKLFNKQEEGNTEFVLSTREARVEYLSLFGVEIKVYAIKTRISLEHYHYSEISREDFNKIEKKKMIKTIKDLINDDTGRDYTKKHIKKCAFFFDRSHYFENGDTLLDFSVEVEM